MKLPDLDSLLPAFMEREAVRKYAAHNVDLWRRTVGGLQLTLEKRRPFDPRADYWAMPERRLLIAYFARRYAGCYAPVAAVRALAFGVFRHFETARAQKHLGDPLDADTQNQRWAEWCVKLRDVAATLPEVSPEYSALVTVWGPKTFSGATLRENLRAFIDETEAIGILKAEDPLGKRIVWFPYLGLNSPTDLGDAQRFFFGLYTVFTSTNAYQNAGSQTFAPVLQNTDTKILIDYAVRWAKGEKPTDTKFMVLSRLGYELRDCSHYNTVTELYGFLNLPRGPIYNNAAASLYEAYAKPEDVGSLPRVLRVGDQTRAFVRDRPALMAALLKELKQLRTTPWGNLIEIEGIHPQRMAARRSGDVALLVDSTLRTEVGRHFDSYLDSLGDVDGATAFLNILLDAFMYARDIAADKAAQAGAGAPAGATSGESSKPETEASPPPADGRRLVLPTSLRPVAEEALALLRAGFHVLLAGAPGTGKTTVAQLVGNAWNRNLPQVPGEIPLEAAPRTVVAHSAWATFHTVGGLLPVKGGSFEVRPGIFVTESKNPRVWQLRGECFVLDEMNRADLDRCIGDLYPILSRSVAAVAPAGLPDVDTIKDHDQFRILATVNDATLDDIVFPISEGLARRFLRIELPGATVQDVKEFIGADSAAEERQAAANEVVDRLFDAAREQKKLSKTEQGDHLPFGVGYFGPLKAWVAGSLTLAMVPDASVQAEHVLLLALRGMARVRGFQAVLKDFEG